MVNVPAGTSSCPRVAPTTFRCRPFPGRRREGTSIFSIPERYFPVSERGFGQLDAKVFDTLDIVAAWQGAAYPWVACDRAATRVAAFTVN